MLQTIKDLYYFDFKKVQVKYELFEYALLNIAIFAIPFFFGHPQVIVGTAVNAIIIYTSIRYKQLKLIPIIFLPSLAVLARGVMFGPLTIYIVKLAPFIWLSNAIIMFSIRFIMLKLHNKSISFAVGSVLKFLFLFTVIHILVANFHFPKPFLAAMGLTQLYTALAGGGLNLIISTIRK